jgi:hypothetical protein
MNNGDLWRQSTFAVTAAAKNLWSYGVGEAKDPVDIMIQNTHANALLYVNLSGDAVADDTNWRIAAGATLSLTNVTNTVSIIGSAPQTIPYAYCRNAGRRHV